LDPTGRDVQAEGSRLRAQGPVAQVELPGGIRAWSVVGYEMVRQVLADERFAKDGRKHWPAYVNGEISDAFPLIGWVLMDNMTTHDGADHARLRNLTAKAFTLRRTKSMQPRVERIVRELLDDLATAAPGEVVDLKARYAYPLPTKVICELFGVPEHMRATVMRGGEVNTDTTLTHEEAVANVVEWHEAMYGLVAMKKKNPDDDLLSDLITTQEADGSQMSDAELAGTLHLMLGAGSETIPKGDPVLIGFAASGRDPQRHGATADNFDITRSDKDHLSFGWGIHHCLGAPLARLEAAIGLPALFERFPALELAVPAGQVEPQGTFLLNGAATLPIRLTPAT
jgi:cytochrome P450